jgi:hypothetical protein
VKRMFALFAACIVLTQASAVAAEPWKPAAGPLMTRWARDVTPENVHPEYPRPQMVRHDWLNLNGNSIRAEMRYAPSHQRVKWKKTGAAKQIESMRSSTPPWPSISVP